MNTAMGIVILVVCAAGVYSVASWIFRAMCSGLVPYNNTTRLIKIGHLRTPTPYDQVPQFKGEIGMFGFPRYRDVMVPNKHNYATVVYMDHPVKQYAYDVMGSWREASSDKRFWPFWTLILTVGYLFNPLVGLTIACFLLWFILWAWPSSSRMERRSAENAKNFTPDTWRGIYRDVAESIEREDEMARAFRKSGGGWGRW